MEEKRNIKKKIYCEMAFWNEFRNSYPTSVPLPTDTSIQKLQTWIDLYSFICKSNIAFDCSKDDFVSHIVPSDSGNQDIYLYLLWKRHASGLLEITFGPDSFIQLGCTPISKMKETDLLAVYLTKEAKEAAQDFGVINITPLSYFENGSLFRDNGIAIAKDEQKDWNFLKQAASNKCNSMIITDNYILKKPSLKNNLFHILDALLPHQLCIPFHFSIVATNAGGSWDESISLLEKQLALLRPHLKIQFDSCEVEPRDIHDRTIITNNLWISCAGGFDLFYWYQGKLLAGKSTTINIVYPFIQNINGWTNDAYLNNIEDVSYIYQDYDVTCRNRLFRMLEE